MIELATAHKYSIPIMPLHCDGAGGLQSIHSISLLFIFFVEYKEESITSFGLDVMQITVELVEVMTWSLWWS